MTSHKSTHPNILATNNVDGNLEGGVEGLNAADDIFANSEGIELSGQFTFDGAVARVFPDMIKRSVPGYAETVAMSGVIAGEYARDNTNLYDLGCSLGAVTLAMRHGVKTWQRTVATAVKFKHLSDDEIAQYLHSNEWQGKAGGYGIQGPAAALIPWIQGSFTAVVGLPLAEGSNLPDLVFFGCGVLIGGMGGVVQSASRSLMVRHSDPTSPTEYFGLYGLSGRATAFIAPSLIGVVTAATGSARIGISPVIALFALGLFLLIWVKPDGDRS